MAGAIRGPMPRAIIRGTDDRRSDHGDDPGADRADRHPRGGLPPLRFALCGRIPGQDEPPVGDAGCRRAGFGHERIGRCEGCDAGCPSVIATGPPSRRRNRLRPGIRPADIAASALPVVSRLATGNACGLWRVGVLPWKRHEYAPYCCCIWSKFLPMTLVITGPDRVAPPVRRPAAPRGLGTCNRPTRAPSTPREVQHEDSGCR